MMWFPTKRRVGLLVIDLLARIARIEGRVKTLGQKMSGMDELLGRSPHIVQLEDECSEVWNTLVKTSTGLRLNQVSAREIDRRLPYLEGIVARYESLMSSVENAYLVSMDEYEKAWVSDNAHN
jgi:hypothetical protein